MQRETLSHRLFFILIKNLYNGKQSRKNRIKDTSFANSRGKSEYCKQSLRSHATANSHNIKNVQ
jgi:hypothetical protein